MSLTNFPFQGIVISYLHRSRGLIVCLFVCLFGVFHPTREFFTHEYGDVTITVEGLQILTYARRPWPLSSEGSLTCHTSRALRLQTHQNDVFNQSSWIDHFHSQFQRSKYFVYAIIFCDWFNVLSNWVHTVNDQT